MKRTLASVVLLAILSLPLRAAEIPIAINGRALGQNAKPVPNARVALIPVLSLAESGRMELAGRMEPDPVTTAPVDAAGGFRLKAPGAGMWKVRVEAPGFVPMELPLLPLLEETDLPEVLLSPDARLQVRLADAQGRPAAGARVRVEDARPSARLPGSWQIPARFAVTDAGGSATLPRAPQEVSGVRAMPASASAGLLPAEQKEVRGGAASLRFAPGEARRIQVRDPKGKGVAGVIVRFGSNEPAVGRTSEAGLLDLTVPAGGADLRLAALDGRQLSYRLRPAKPKERGAAAPANPEIIVLPAPVPATGRIVSAQDGRPVPGALAWPAGDYGAVVRAGADGAFRLPALADPEGSVEAAAAGFFPEDRQAAAGHLPTLALQPRLAASGIVVDEAGRPVAGAGVKASYRMNAQMARSQALFRSGGFARSGESGRFRLPALLAGVAYDLQVYAQGFAPTRAELPAREAGSLAPELRLVLRSGRTAFGVVLDAGHHPLAGAQVFLQTAAPMGGLGRLRASRNVERLLGPATDAAGRFEFKHVQAGTFDLLIHARGFARLTVPGLTVPEGKGATDLGTVALSPGASVRGLVTDPKGAPVEGAEVRAKAAERDQLPVFSTRDPGPADALTAADGSFVLEDRSPGESLDLAVARAGYGPGAAPGVAVPAESPVHIVLQPAVRVSGRVSEPDGKAIAGASVLLGEETPMSVGGHSALITSGRFHRGVTDDEGGFVFDGVSPGPINVSAQAPRRQEAELKGLEVKPGQDLTGLALVLPPAAAVEGRVLSPDGHPVQDAEVTVVEASQTDFSFSSLRATTDADGQYRIDGVPPGPRTLEARAQGYRRAVRDVEVTVEARAVDFRLERGLEVSGRTVDDAGNPVSGADVLLIAGNDVFNASRALTGADGAFHLGGLQDGTYRLIARKEGYVSNPQGETVTLAGAPVSGLEVKLSGGGTITGRLSGLEFSQLSRVRVWADSALYSGRVDPEGTYQIPHLPPRSWTVTAIVPDTPLHAEGRVILQPGAAEARLDLQFGGGHALTGVVLRNGEPLAGASLVLAKADAAPTQTVATDHQGGFRFGGLDNGVYNLDVSTPNGAQHHESVEISGDREIRVELRTVSLAGRVIDALDSSPVSGAQIALVPDGDRPAPFTDATTDARGVFRLIEVGDGAWKLRATREGYSPAERVVRVDGSAPDEVEIRMNPTEGITVEALLASGQPPDRLRVAVLDGGGKAIASGTYPTGENGRTRLSNVPPGSWQLLVESDQSAAVTVAASSPGPAVHVLLPPGGQVRVRVPALAASDANAKVVLTGSGGTFRGIDWDGSVRSEWDLAGGTRLFPRMPAGIWQVVARTPDGRSWTGTATVAPGGVAEVVLK